MASQPRETDLGEKGKVQRGGGTNTRLNNFGTKDDKVQDADFAHLTEHEQLILKRQIEVPDAEIGLTTMFRYATKNDLLIIFISSLCAIIGGGILPLMSVSLFCLYAQKLFNTDEYRSYLVPLPKIFRVSRCCLHLRELPLIAFSSPRHCTLST
jgi:hypothetical protein